jgi:hypothetical protein
MTASRYALSVFIWILSGYSFKSNEYGLAIDNVVAYELVLPNGTVTTVTADDHDLWFALRVSVIDSSHCSLAEISCRAVGITSCVAQGPSHLEVNKTIFRVL